jgi:hypothetical protein
MSNSYRIDCRLWLEKALLVHVPLLCCSGRLCWQQWQQSIRCQERLDTPDPMRSDFPFNRSNSDIVTCRGPKLNMGRLRFIIIDFDGSRAAAREGSRVLPFSLQLLFWLIFIIFFFILSSILPTDLPSTPWPESCSPFPLDKPTKHS